MLGAGGHASVLAEICLGLNRPIIAVVAPEQNIERSIFLGMEQLTQDSQVMQYSPEEVELVNGIGSMPGSDLRKSLASAFSELGYQFATIVSAAANVSSMAKLSEGVQILPGSTVNAGVTVGEHSIINSGSVVEHDCFVESFVSIAPGSTICGGVTLGHGVHIGPNAVVAQGVQIGANALIGAGSSVVRSVKSCTKILPAKIIKLDGNPE